MKRDILFVGMDIIKELDKMYEETEKTTGEPMSDEEKLGYEWAKRALEVLLHTSLEEGTCVVDIKGLKDQEEFFKSDLFKYFDKHDFYLPEVE